MTTQELQVIDVEEEETSLEVAESPNILNAGVLRIPDKEQAILLKEIPGENLDILPTGEVYLSQVHYRRILNEAFGVGQWALVPRGDWKNVGATVCRDYALFVRGCYVSETIGEQDYHANNPNMSWATACEGAKSNALMRLCKDLGIASQCWDRRYTEEWKREYAVKVFVKKKDGKTTVQWRRKDAEPFYNETGIVPNQGTTVPKTRIQETASVRSSDEGNDGGGSESATGSADLLAGQPEPVVPKSGAAPELRDLKDGETLGVFEIRNLKPTPDRKYKGQAHLLNGAGDTLGGQWGVNIFSETDWNTLHEIGLGNQVAVIYTVNGKWINVQAIGRAS